MKILTNLIGKKVKVKIGINDLTTEQANSFYVPFVVGKEAERQAEMEKNWPTYDGEVVSVYIVGGTITPTYTIKLQDGTLKDVTGNMVTVVAE